MMASRSTLSTSFFVDLPLSKSARIFRRLWGRRSDPRCSALKGGFLGSSGMVVAGARDSYRQWMDRCRQSNSKGRSGPQLFRKLPLISGYAVNHGVASSLYANLFSSSASLLGVMPMYCPACPASFCEPGIKPNYTSRWRVEALQRRGAGGENCPYLTRVPLR